MQTTNDDFIRAVLYQLGKPDKAGASVIGISPARHKALHDDWKALNIATGMRLGQATLCGLRVVVSTGVDDDQFVLGWLEGDRTHNDVDVKVRKA